MTLFDGSHVHLSKLASHWDPNNRTDAIAALQQAKNQGEVLTGLIYIDPDSKDLHDILRTVDKPLNSLREEDLCPGAERLEAINAAHR